MSQTRPNPAPVPQPADEIGYLPVATASPPQTRGLFRAVVLLALPVLAENFLSIVVGLNDAYLANHLPADIRVDGTAAVGTVVYLLWFIGLFSGALGTGATAIISRAVGARHRARASACVGQSMLLAALLGLGLAVVFFAGSPLIATAAGLSGRAHDLTVSYLRLLAPGVPGLVVLFVANACLRGAGDTRTPFYSMCVVNAVNVAVTWALTFGVSALHLPALGISGIAVGTTAAYLVGGVLQTAVLLRGTPSLRLHLHRLRLHRREMARLLRIGLPSAAENALMWGVNFFLVYVVNVLGAVSSAAHLNAIRLESLSFMTGFAVAAAAATTVGQSLGMNDVSRARRAAYYCYVLGGGAMTLFGLLFIFGGHALADVMSEDPAVRDLTARCLFITGFIQPFFAAYIIFSAALRGAGDTRAVLTLNLLSVCVVRLGGVFVVGHLLHLPLSAVWIVLCAELALRGSLAYARFASGGWARIRV